MTATHETRLACNCPSCRWARAGFASRFVQWLTPYVALALGVIGIAMIMGGAVFVVIWAGELLFHFSL